MTSEPVSATTAGAETQSPLDRKILEHFPGLVVRKDLTTELKQNAVVPTYVLEYLLGQHCATDDPTLIQEGLESVRRILSKHYVHRNQAELVKSTIKERGTHKVIDKLTVELNEKGGFYEVEFTNLGLKKVPIEVDFIKRYPKLLVGGIWAITDVEYELPAETEDNVWSLTDSERRAMGIQPLPQSLDHAIRKLEESELAAETLGEEVFGYVLANKRREWNEVRAQVTPFELKQNLETL